MFASRTLDDCKQLHVGSPAECVNDGAVFNPVGGTASGPRRALPLAELQACREPRTVARATARDRNRPFRCRFDEVGEDVARLEHPGVVGEPAEHDPHGEAFEIVAPVPRVRQRIVQPPDPLSGLDVRGS